MTDPNESWTQFYQLIEVHGPRFVSSMIGGAFLGIERQIFSKPAGLRTCIMVALGSCLITIVSIVAAHQYGGDPMRVTAQIVTGVGFIGGGVILHYRNRIEGITTATTIFVCAAVGITAGAGYIFTAVAVSLAMVAVLLLLRPVDRFIESHPAAVRLRAQEAATEIDYEKRLEFLEHPTDNDEKDPTGLIDNEE